MFHSIDTGLGIGQDARIQMIRYPKSRRVGFFRDRAYYVKRHADVNIHEVHAPLDMSFCHPSPIFRAGRDDVIRPPRLTEKTRAGAKNPRARDFPQGDRVSLRQDPVNRVSQIPDRGDAVGKKELATVITIMHMIINETGKNSLAARINDPSLLGKIYFSLSHALDAVVLNDNGGLIDGFTSVAVNETTSLDNNRGVFCCHGVISPPKILFVQARDFKQIACHRQGLACFFFTPSNWPLQREKQPMEQSRRRTCSGQHALTSMALIFNVIVYVSREEIQMKRFKMFPVVCLFFLGFHFPLAKSNETASAAEVERLNVVYSSIAGASISTWGPKEAGIYKKYGLDVNLIYVAGSQAIATLISGDAQIAQASGAAAILSRLT